MYLENFKLRELPFRLSPDPQFLFLSRAHARAKAYMESTIWFTDGFVVITGEIGAGKTTLIESFLRQLDSDVVIAQINQTQVSAVEFLQSVLVQFGFSPFKMKKAELIATINSFLIEQYAAGRKVLLIIDEAQNLSLKVLEEVRLLSGIEATKEKVLRIILAGQPELNEKLDSPELVQLAQRVRLRFHLGALSNEDLRPYVEHRLDVAGSEGRQIFADDTFAELYRFTGGVPRLVNTLCDTAMIAASNESRAEVTLADVTSAVGELGWVEFSRRKSTIAAKQRPEVSTANGDRAPKILSKLVLSTEGKAIAELHLVPGRKVIGRTPDNDLQIDSKFISRHHCQFTTTSDGVTILEDLNSTNGIVIRDKRVRRHTLRDGDVVTMGQHEILYVDDHAAEHLADTHDDLPRVSADAANEDAGEEADDDAGHDETASGTR
ncbi:MAG TPA: AAA family ATPase [Steroidobacteraceae bacterium]|nr:AAA family ATPase [Steroidobacteraceae bacterium]